MSVPLARSKVKSRLAPTEVAQLEWRAAVHKLQHAREVILDHRAHELCCAAHDTPTGVKEVLARSRQSNAPDPLILEAPCNHICRVAKPRDSACRAAQLAAMADFGANPAAATSPMMSRKSRPTSPSDAPSLSRWRLWEGISRADLGQGGGSRIGRGQQLTVDRPQADRGK